MRGEYMRRALFLLGMWSLLTGAHAAPSSFTGTWVADLDAQSGLSTDKYLVADGTFRCASCHPPRSYPGDGKPHEIPGAAEPTTDSVTIGGPRTIITRIIQ